MWLDQQQSKLVVYVLFGFGGTVLSEQTKELAFLLA